MEELPSVVAVIPTYIDPETISRPYNWAIIAGLFKTIAGFGLTHPDTRVVLSRDGTGIHQNVHFDDYVRTIYRPEHLGKIGAVIYALRDIITNHPNIEFICFGDQDNDPPSEQINTMIATLTMNHIRGNIPMLVLGERQVALENHGQLGPHRKKMYEIQHLFAEMMGYPNVHDITTGLRIISREFGKQILDVVDKHPEIIAQAPWGCDMLFFMTAKLNQVPIITVQLEEADPRGPSTLIQKFEDLAYVLNVFYKMESSLVPHNVSALFINTLKGGDLKLLGLYKKDLVFTGE